MAVRINLLCIVVINTDLHKITSLNLISPVALIEFSSANSVVLNKLNICCISEE